MPSIKQNTAQQKALANISKQLGEVAAMNSVIAGYADMDAFIGFPTASGRGKANVIKVPVEKGSKDMQKLIRIVTDIRSRIVKDILSQAAKHSIEMEPEDMEILNGCDTEEPETAEGPAAEDTETKTEPMATIAPQPQQMGFDGFPDGEAVPEEFM